MIVDSKTQERFAGRENLDARKIEQLYRDGIWTAADLEPHGLAYVPDPAPEPPVVREPEPEMTRAEKVERMLANYDLTVEDFRAEVVVEKEAIVR